MFHTDVPRSEEDNGRLSGHWYQKIHISGGANHLRERLDFGRYEKGFCSSGFALCMQKERNNMVLVTGLVVSTAGGAAPVVQTVPSLSIKSVFSNLPTMPNRQSPSP
jgi:hypothetical protein